MVASPLGKAAIHFPKVGAYIAIHENILNARMVLVPVPITNSDKASEYLSTAILPDGTRVFITRPIDSPSNPYCKTFAYDENISGLAVSDTGKIAAIATKEHFWVWQQLEEWPKGIGYWTDLTADSRFGVNLMVNHPRTDQLRITHGFMKPRQSFTLHPALSPMLPSNSAVCYQDLCLFDNPDEGMGIVSLTTLLPPSRPFDTLYMFVSICHFHTGRKPTFERHSCSLPIVEGGGAPCIWWSSCCRTAVVAVSQSLVIITRYLYIVKVLPLHDVLPGDRPEVASIAWSACGQFFLVTSKTGAISAITRNGHSMKHNLCGLTPFGNGNFPLLAAGDGYDPGLFAVYSRNEMRCLRIDISAIQRSLDIMIALPFPQGAAEPMYDHAKKLIEYGDYTDKKNLAELLFLTNVYRIFPLYSPLRYTIFQSVSDAAIKFYENGEHLFSILLARCVFWITNKELPTYRPIMERLDFAKTPREKHILHIMKYEVERRDWIEDQFNTDSRNIMMYDPEEASNMKEFERPPDGSDVDVGLVCRMVRTALYSNDTSTFLDVQTNLRPLFDYLLFAGRIDQAYAVGKHPSIGLEGIPLAKEIIMSVATDPVRIWRAMQTCISQDNENELGIRALAVNALNDILKNKIVESSPDKNGKVKPLSKLIEVEDEFEMVCPEDEKQVEDFAVLVSLAIAAADYRNVTNFLKRHYEEIHETLKDSIYELFRLLWFVKYRYSAVQEMVGGAGDSCLRLLGFSDFMNIDAVKEHISQFPTSNFSPDIYAHYISGSRIYTEDPGFVDFAERILANINARQLTRIQTAVDNFTQGKDTVPSSRLLFALVVTDILPYLRCVLARSLTGFECGDKVPEDFRDLEDFQLPDGPEASLIIEKPTSDINEMSGLSAGEFHPPIQPKIPAKRRKHRRKMRQKGSSSDEDLSDLRKKRKPRPVSESDSDDGDTLQPLLFDKVGRHRAPDNFDIPPMYNDFGMYPQQPYPDYTMYAMQVPDIIHGYANPNPENAFGPIWDLDPADFVREEEEVPVREKESDAIKPTRSNASINTEIPSYQPPPPPPVQSPPRERFPRIIFASRPSGPPNPYPNDYDLETSEISDIDLRPPQSNPMPYSDPFPTDDALHRRVIQLLDEANGDPIPAGLKPTPTFKRPPPRDDRVNIPPIPDFGMTPLVNSHISPRSVTETEEEHSYRYERVTTVTNGPPGDDGAVFNPNEGLDSDEGGFPDFKPKLINMKDPRVISVRNPNDRKYQQPSQVNQKKAVLREVTPTNVPPK
ncbi:hypothetical protein TVAG_488030 [Trichomonas vaginalis G3]|uniref:Uncharacterized protein n=1 Tax=Trichomonas vaginalis (strain ATCC PRA-98 / G3) TaxID=412133 RepID=A2E6J6_TRIV3|nr:hypothetical protein TVAGG3_0975030 [Trichomonas vaginalis G3]EAY11701.1 hypothetical protein TVAG_488030 [Trichomonas vaginalis G3]KAI5488863.1 hypothetical protein TVAGG3_0975030 [Trichomonas vaginalis G3]|eukprot:XP_001323924.1 hypothetical protein [Trichomonas vaginalis G3]